jgi:TolB-like protein/DNA-binding winged helix-turn-helix (wHTH) protein/Flp pilus assembly protein TadD
MNFADETVLRIGEWRVDPATDEISRGTETHKLEPRTMRVLLYLAAHPRQVVDVHRLLDEVWPGVVVTPGSVYQAIAQLRRLLGDNAEQPSYIDTHSRKGYRLVASVSPWVEPDRDGQPPAGVDAAAPHPGSLRDATGAPSRRRVLIAALLSAVVVAAALGWVFTAGKRTAPLSPPAVSMFSPPPHSIAVLPFVNMSGDASQDYFSDGITEELLNSLSRVNELQVAARTSSFYFKGKDVDLPAIAHKLNVASVLEGSVRRSGARIRITAQLNNAVTGFHLWSQTYDRDIGDVLQLQTEIATAVAAALKVTLLSDVGAKIELGGTRNPAALDAYVRASNAYWTLPEGQGDDLAVIDEFTEAIRLDPEYALAYADRSLALSSSVQGAKGRVVLDYLNESQADARKAIALAPDLAEGHLALASLSQMSLDFAGATTEYERASALAPGNARVLRDYGAFAVSMGKTEVGLAAARRGVVLDPLNPQSHYWLGISLTLARRYDAAIASFANAKALSSNDPFLTPVVDGLIGLSYYMAGTFADARGACGRGDEYLSLICQAVTYDKLGQRADAQTILAKLQSLRGDNGALAYAMICGQRGDKGKALEWLDKATRLHDPWLQYLKVLALFDPLREEPRFQAIERELKFPE